MSQQKNSSTTQKDSCKQTKKEFSAFRQLIKESTAIAASIAQLTNDLQTTIPPKSTGNKKEPYFLNQYVIEKDINTNYQNFKLIFDQSSDVIFRRLRITDRNNTQIFICFIKGIVDEQRINNYIVRPLHHFTPDQPESADLITQLQQHIFTAIEINVQTDFDEVINGILEGNAAVFIDGFDQVLLINAKGGKTRSVEEPHTEVTIRGSRDGFTELNLVNISLVRRRIKNTNLIIEPFILGKETHTNIAIAYIKGIAAPAIIDELKYRLNKINTDSILESGYIEQLIEDHPFSLFPTIGNSEKPDKVAAKILEGRVAIFCSGTPFVLTVPFLFIETLQTTEDYYSRIYIVNIYRMIRFFSLFTTMVLPALYIALETFNQEMVPTVLLIKAAAAREGIPFPTFIETIIMGILFEIIRESGVRLPRQVGQAVSIVGALVIGEAAVSAGIISAPMVIIGAITGITSFVVPPLQESIIIIRIFLIFCSATFGLFGVIIGMMLILTHICSLRSFGIPYFEPIAPLIWTELKDTIFRAPLWLLKSKPKLFTVNNLKQKWNTLIKRTLNRKRGTK
ncbi:MAG: spore gernimation protein [Firmicutes bacterium]|nr:spore gernimation protein [Bacillota bacterium]